ncbi:hypothetical protein DFH11DRAFT_1316599 [Phellopilus nigrolimitatus]|nr:hypothetical protein DFH11DRAFT_1316599 [Phellopilus nigrolimitatus]
MQAGIPSLGSGWPQRRAASCRGARDVDVWQETLWHWEDKSRLRDPCPYGQPPATEDSSAPTRRALGSSCLEEQRRVPPSAPSRPGERENGRTCCPRPSRLISRECPPSVKSHRAARLSASRPASNTQKPGPSISRPSLSSPSDAESPILEKAPPSASRRSEDRRSICLIKKILEATLHVLRM